MAGSIRSFLHYIDLRRSNGTQKEHRDIALGCGKLFGKSCQIFTTLTFPMTDDRKERLLAALEAARKAKNPVMVRSIQAALRDEVVDPFEGMSIHPEVDHLWNFPSE